MRTLIGLFLLTLLPALSNAQSAEAPKGFGLWNSPRIQELGDRLQKQIGDKEIAFETLGSYQGHSVYLVLRGKTARRRSTTRRSRTSRSACWGQGHLRHRRRAHRRRESCRASSSAARASRASAHFLFLHRAM